MQDIIDSLDYHYGNDIDPHPPTFLSIVWNTDRATLWGAIQIVAQDMMYPDRSSESSTTDAYATTRTKSADCAG